MMSHEPKLTYTSRGNQEIRPDFDVVYKYEIFTIGNQSNMHNAHKVSFCVSDVMKTSTRLLTAMMFGFSVQEALPIHHKRIADFYFGI